jgi:hypothetical protein
MANALAIEHCAGKFTGKQRGAQALSPNGGNAMQFHRTLAIGLTAIAAAAIVGYFIVRRTTYAPIWIVADQHLLSKIAKDAEIASASRGITAAERITDQALLGDVAIEGHDKSVQIAAVRRLDDQVILANVAMNVRPIQYEVAIEAIHKLSVAPVLAKIAVENEVWLVRSAAVAQIEDQSLLAKIAEEDPDQNVRLAAVIRLTDQTALAKIATTNEDSRMRYRAVQRLDDQVVLARIVALDKDESVVFAAESKLPGGREKHLEQQRERERAEAAARTAAARKWDEEHPEEVECRQRHGPVWSYSSGDLWCSVPAPLKP